MLSSSLIKETPQTYDVLIPICSRYLIYNICLHPAGPPAGQTSFRSGILKSYIKFRFQYGTNFQQIVFSALNGFPLFSHNFFSLQNNVSYSLLPVLTAALQLAFLNGRAHKWMLILPTFDVVVVFLSTVGLAAARGGVIVHLSLFGGNWRCLRHALKSTCGNSKRCQNELLLNKSSLYVSSLPLYRP